MLFALEAGEKVGSLSRQAQPSVEYVDLGGSGE
jgi:hypothetical protein